MLRTASLFLVALVFATPAHAQIEQCTGYIRLIDDVIAGKPGAPENLVDIGQAPRCFALFIAGLEHADRSAFKDFVRRLEGARADKQTAAPAAGAGSTSIVAQGPVAKVLSVAAEYGALTQEVSGQAITVRGNLAGLPAALVKNDIFPYCVGTERLSGFCVDGSLLGVLKRFSFGVSFEPARTQVLTVDPATPPAGTPPTVNFTGTVAEVSSVSLHVDLWNRRDTSSPEFTKAWRAKVGQAMDQASADLLRSADFVEQVKNLATYDAWAKASAGTVRAAGSNRADVAKALTSALEQLAIQAKPIAGFDERVAEALAAYSRFFLAQDDLIDSLAKKTVVAFEMTNSRPVSQPTTSNYRVILDLPLSKQTKLVANAAFTFYDAIPSGQTSAYRDAQVGAQLDHGLGKASIVGPAVFSLAAYYQYQHTPTLLEVDPTQPVPGVAFSGLPEGAKEVFVTTGNIILVQAKLSIVPASSSVKIPISLTWSNKSELVDHPRWRAQIGMNYDLDGLFALLNGR
jgi:hypothetical protein